MAITARSLHPVLTVFPNALDVYVYCVTPWSSQASPVGARWSLSDRKIQRQRQEGVLVDFDTDDEEQVRSDQPLDRPEAQSSTATRQQREWICTVCTFCNGNVLGLACELCRSERLC